MINDIWLIRNNDVILQQKLRPRDLFSNNLDAWNIHMNYNYQSLVKTGRCSDQEFVDPRPLQKWTWDLHHVKYRTLKPPWASASLSRPNQPTDLPQIWNSIQNVKNIQISLNNLLKKCNFCTDFIQICDFSLKSPFFQTLQSIWTSCLGCSGCHFCHSCHLLSSPFSLLFWSGELEMSKSWILSFLKK